jgi:hypothetical protein
LTAYATTKDVKTFASDLADELLNCRQFGHSWEPYTVELNGRLYEQVLRCKSCETERVLSINKRGQVLKSHYRYADGYVLEALGRIVGDARAVLRVEGITRLLTAQEKASARKTRSRRRLAPVEEAAA